MYLRYSETAMRSTQITRFLFIAGIVYIVLVIVAVVLAFRWTYGSGGSTDEATKLAAIWVSLLTGALGAAASLSVAFVQRENNQILTDLQAKSAQRLEARKVQISAEQKAYDELSAAASYYYYTVKQIEGGQFEQQQTREAERGMVSACRYLFAISEDDTKIWMQVWQRSRYVALEAATKEPPEQKQLYNEHIKDLDNHYELFVTAARHHHLSEGV